MSNRIKDSSREDKKYDKYFKMIFELEFLAPNESRRKSLEILTEIILEKNPGWEHLTAGGFDADFYQTHQVNDGRKDK